MLSVDETHKLFILTAFSSYSERKIFVHMLLILNHLCSYA